MIKKIFHLSDLHIRTYKYHDEYREVFKTLISQLRNLANHYDRDEMRIVITGDLVHQKVIISNEQILLLSWLLKELESIANVVIIAGNHDLLENNKDRVDSISPIVDLLSGLNIRYLKESKCYIDYNIVWCCYSIFEENKRPDIESGRIQYGDDKTYVGLFHGPIIGSKTDLGYVIEYGYGLDIFDGCDMVLCGDIHKRGGFNYKNIPIYYASSLLQNNFGESVSGHGFLLWNVETRSFVEQDVLNENLFYSFKIRSLEDLDNGGEILTNG